MSNTMEIFCDECKEKYWYAQTSRSVVGAIYSPEKLERFMEKHRYHQMHTETAYSSDCSPFKTGDYTDWEDKKTVKCKICGEDKLEGNACGICGK